MSTDIQRVVVITYTTSPTTLSNLNTISVLNGGSDALTISADGGLNSVTLSQGQTLQLVSNTGFVLPPITLSGSNMVAEVIFT
jgi:hypothetical protein